MRECMSEGGAEAGEAWEKLRGEEKVVLRKRTRLCLHSCMTCLAYGPVLHPTTKKDQLDASLEKALLRVNNVCRATTLLITPCIRG
jgi:hypothetical protein